MKAEKYGSELIMKINLSPPPTPTPRTYSKSRPKILTNNGAEQLDHAHSQIVIIGRTELDRVWPMTNSPKCLCSYLKANLIMTMMNNVYITKHQKWWSHCH